EGAVELAEVAGVEVAKVVAGVEVVVLGAAAEIDLLGGVEVEAEVSDELALAEDVVVEVGVVDGEVVEGEVAAVVDEGALLGRNLGEGAGVGLALDEVELAVEALDGALGSRGGSGDQQEQAERERESFGHWGGIIEARSDGTKTRGRSRQFL